MPLAYTRAHNPHAPDFIQDILNCTIPCFISEYEYPCSPYYDKVKLQTESYMVDCNLLNQDEMIRFMRADFAKFVCLTHPYAQERHLRCIADFTVWIWLMDSFVDSPYFPLAHGFFSEIMHIMKGDSIQLTNNWLVTFKDIWVRLDLPEVHKARIIEDLNNYLTNYALIFSRQKDLDKVMQISLDQYMNMRRLDAGAKTMLVLIEHCLGIELSDQEYIELSPLMDVFIDYVIFTNDILSVKKEVVEGDVMNMVIIIKYQEQCSAQEAVEKCYGICLDLQKEFEVMSQIQDKDDSRIRRYKQAMKTWVNGYFLWTSNTSKYNPAQYMPLNA